ncbi:MAG: hypothetical protein L0I24_02340 [Pseudonocardia sp.]|nr:hypothetical protein [Pseudonocardia sp.]
MTASETGLVTESERQVRALEQRARSAGVGSEAPDVPELRAVMATLGRLYRNLVRNELHSDLQRHIAALHRLISRVCDAHTPAAPKRASTPRHRATTTRREQVHVDHRSPYQRFPEESGDSIQTLGGGLPGLGRRR